MAFDVSQFKELSDEKGYIGEVVLVKKWQCTGNYK